MKVLTRTRKKIKMNLEISELALTSSEIIVCGLILNEMISNAFKYAFQKPRLESW